MSSDYQQQLDLINAKLEETHEGPEKNELLSLKQNIEELIFLTTDNIEANEEKQEIDDEYALFMAELSKEDAFTSQEANNCSEVAQKIKDLEGKKFRAPHKHSWGQMTYHNAMICSVPQEADSFEELEVKVLFLNPTHKEMLPCPYYFDLAKDCRFSEEECRYSHGKLVSFSTLEEYQEPKFETLKKGSEVLAKKTDNLWYRAKIEKILEERCLVKFNEKNKHGSNSEEVVFQHILPLKKSDEESSGESDVEEIGSENERDNEKTRQELINKSLLITPEAVPLGDWEKHTKGIGSRLMQKMGYIVGTGLGKDGGGIVKPVTALILPQGKSLDFCMNLKEKANDPHLFHHDVKKSNRERKLIKKSCRIMKKKKINLESLNLQEFVTFFFSKLPKKKPRMDKERDSRMLKDKMSRATGKDMYVTNYIIEKTFKDITNSIQELKQTIQRLEKKHADPKPVYSKLRHKEIDLERLNFFAVIVNGELGRRKNNKEMSEF